MVGFFDDPTDEELRQRDRMQFELRSTYSPIDESKRMTYTHEFYFFVPGSLQINAQTYKRNQFYLDQTSLVRFRTPRLSLRELGNRDSNLSPLGRIDQWIQDQKTLPYKQTKFELKLFGNMARSQIRDRTYTLLEQLHNQKGQQDLLSIAKEIDTLCEDIHILQEKFSSFQKTFYATNPLSILQKFCGYVDEFFCTLSENYLLLLLRKIRKHNVPDLEKRDDTITNLVLSLKAYRQEKGYHSPYDIDDEKKREHTLYRASLLNKFVLEALLLSTQRKQPVKRFDQLIATTAAGLAMFLYIFLLAWYGRAFIVDATAFVIVSVILYILKDRLKEGLKTAYYKLAFRLFPDYTTKILTTDERHTLGELKESFTFLSRGQLPKEILNLRDQTFHSELELARRLENIIHFKKEVILEPGYTRGRTGLKDLHDIFRFNISQFTLKASDTYQESLDLDAITKEILIRKCPKVYHINVIIKKTFSSGEGKEPTEISKVRIILNKEGIERIEPLD